MDQSNRRFKIIVIFAAGMATTTVLFAALYFSERQSLIKTRALMNQAADEIEVVQKEMQEATDNSKPKLADDGSRIGIDPQAMSFYILGSITNISGGKITQAVAGFSIYRGGVEIDYRENQTFGLDPGEVWKFRINDVGNVMEGKIQIKLKRLDAE